MTYRTLLVAVDDGPGSDARVRLACDLAVGARSHLVGVCGVAVTTPPLDDSFAGGSMLGEALTLFRDVALAEIRSAEARFHAIADLHDISREWRGRLGLPADIIRQDARAADIVILGPRSGRPQTRCADPADVLMAIGRPVLVAPPQPARDPTGLPAVLAWTESREAQRAAAAAIPLLECASQVHVMQVVDDDLETMRHASAVLSDVVAWLGRHGIAAQAHVEVRGQPSTAQTILAFAEAHNAGLIIAGGFGRSRLREWSLGGVTSEFLATASIPILLSH